MFRSIKLSKLRSKMVLFFLIGVIIFLSANILLASAAEYTIKIAHVQPPDDVYAQSQSFCNTFKSIVEGKTNGNVKVEIYPSGQLGGEGEILKGVQMGTIEMGLVATGPIPQFFKDILVYSVPFGVPNRSVAWEIANSDFTKNLMGSMLEKTGMRTLMVSSNGFRCFTNNVRPIKTPDDMKGLKIRMMENPAHLKIVSSLGGNPTPLAATELYMALQQGVVDGQDNGPAGVYNMKLYEVQKYLTMDSHIFDFHFAIINEKFFQKLPESYQIILVEAAKEAKVVEWGMMTYQAIRVLDLFEEKGMEIYYPTNDEIDKFREIASPQVIEYLKEEVGSELVEEYLNCVEQAKIKSAEF